MANGESPVVGLRKWITGMVLIAAAVLVPFFREFPLESQILWAGVGIAIGGNVLDKVMAMKKNGG